MKFSNGCWLNKDGIDAYGPVQAYDIETDDNSISVLATTRFITNRGDTLGGPVIKVRLSSPMYDTIRVQIFHYKGINIRGPKFKITSMPEIKTDIVNNETSASLTSGNLSVRISKTGNWNMGFYNGDERITGSGYRQISYIKDAKNNAVFMREQLDLSVGECIYGLGEHFTAFVKNGQTVDMWNEDGGTSTQQAYKNIPFYITNKGYGVFVNHPERVSFEVGSEKVNKVQFSVPGEYLEYYVINGPSMKKVLENYTFLTGRPALPPAWSFGLWLTTSFTTNYDEKTVTSIIDGMAKRDLPLHVFHFDCFWMKGFNWCDFQWDERVFPDPENMLKRLKKNGLKICVWINPYISQESKLFDEGMKNGYLIKRPNGDIWQWDMWQPAMGIVDFTNPNACEWFASKLNSLIDMGVDCFKTDFGERIPTDVVYFDGSDPVKMHNYYTFLYNKTVFDVLKKRFGEGNAVLFARSATAGSQRFPVHWGGDSTADYESMAESLRGGLSLCLSGFGFWSHDIGGFESKSSADVYKRWVAFGLLSSHSRLHGSSSYRVPWLYDEEAVNVVRLFTKLKCSLMPYIFKNACEASKKGIPVMRAMVLEFQNDPSCDYLDRQYMLGDSLLVAPVFNKKGHVSYYLPKGIWTNLLSGKTIEGGCWRKEIHDYLSMPLMVRPNSIIAIGSENRKPDYDYVDRVTLHVFELQDKSTASTIIYNINGQAELTVSISRMGNCITIDSNGTDKAWNILLRGIFNIDTAKGASFKIEELGTRLAIPKQAKHIKCILK
ncbi:MAG: alpha-xylosidase [Clostridiales bacterium]|nr:alpha-xylosidase [Clostridiales bacterium]